MRNPTASATCPCSTRSDPARSATVRATAKNGRFAEIAGALQQIAAVEQPMLVWHAPVEREHATAHRPEAVGRQEGDEPREVAARDAIDRGEEAADQNAAVWQLFQRADESTGGEVQIGDDRR